MARIGRTIAAGVCYHVINRSNNRVRLFHAQPDYRYFLIAMQKAREHVELDIFAACLMPNHVHLVARPQRASDLGRWMQRVMTTHVRWHHQRYRTSGRLWQGRYKAFPIQEDGHLLTVIRYVERNALRAQLVERAQDWPWGSLAWRAKPDARKLLCDPPVVLPSEWASYVNAPQSPAELDRLRVCVNRQRPFGQSAWVESTARQLGTASSLAARGRPRKHSASSDWFDPEA